MIRNYFQIELVLFDYEKQETNVEIYVITRYELLPKAIKTRQRGNITELRLDL